MLPSACLGNNPPLTHAESEQALAERVVDLVGTGVAEVFPLEIDSRSARILRQPVCKKQRRLATHKAAEQIVEFLLKGGVGGRLGVGLLKLVEGC